MAYHDNIDLFQESQRNRADVFNEPLQKLIANIEDTRSLIGDVQSNVDDLEDNLRNNYTATEELNDLLATGIKGDKGEDGIDGTNGKNLEFVWNQYELGVRQEGETEYQYTYLRGEKGEPGDVSTEQMENAIAEAINEAKTEIESEISNIPIVTKTSDLTNDSGFITVDDIPDVDLEPYALKTEIPTTLPASDVYDWAKASTKPTYTASEVGALASNGTAVNASKVANALTLQVAGTTKNTFNGSSAQTFNIPNASTSAAGVMTTAMVTKLNGIATGATKNTVDTAMSSTSTNAVQNKVIYAYIQEQIQNQLKNAGDYVGKTMVDISTYLVSTDSGYTYTNAKGGLIDVSFEPYSELAEFTLIVDGVTILNNVVPSQHLKKIESTSNTYELKVPFKTTVTIRHYCGEDRHSYIRGFAYVNS